MTVITRFAPSPTGFLHIGGARTALFNYLFAKHHGGRYLLRIEDTDKQRSTEEAIKAIIEGLKWLGLEGDEPEIYQSQKLNRHKQVANELAVSGAAYYCYLSEEEIQTLRQENKRDGKPFRSPWRKTSYKGNKNQKPVLRLRMPDEKDTIINDLVQGEVRVANKQLDDLVLMRSDKTPTYMLAVVVDDYDMGITHIIRGDDHLNNAIRQTKIYNSLNWQPPIFGHIPLIHGTDGTKLSKRHGATGLDGYKNMGIYSEAMINYLARLGWSHGDNEYFSLQQATKWFDGSSIGRSPARFDMQKLVSINAYWLKKQSTKSIYEQILRNHRQKSDKPISNAFEARFNKLHPHFTKKASIISELLSQIDYLLYDGAPEIADEVKAIITENSRTILKSFSNIVDETPLNAEAFESFINSWLKEKGLIMKDLGIPLRIALTGNKSAPTIFDLIQALGFEEVKVRIQQICN